MLDAVESGIHQLPSIRLGLGAAQPSSATAAFDSESWLFKAFRDAVERATTAQQLSKAAVTLATGESTDSPSIVLTTFLLRRCTVGISKPRPALRGAAYVAAKAQWEAEGLVGGGAGQNLPLVIAATDLKHMLSAHPGSTEYLAALAAMNGMEGVPDAMVTPVEDRLANAASAVLTKFFGTGFSTGAPTTSYFRRAAAAWEKEPTSSRAGLTRLPIMKALADLRTGLGETPRSKLYGAAIDDLQHLLVAPRSALVQAGQSSLRLRIDFLNVVFAEASPLTANYHQVLV